MKAFLMHPDRSFVLEDGMSWNEETITKDLELDTLLSTISAGDDFLLKVARQSLRSAFGNDMKTILHRQDCLRDCFSEPEVVKGMYDLVTDTLAIRRKHWLGIYSRTPSGILSDSVNLLELLFDSIRKMRAMLGQKSPNFRSTGFVDLLSLIEREFDDDFLTTAGSLLSELKLSKGTPLEASLGAGNSGEKYELMSPRHSRWKLVRELFSRRNKSLSFRLHERDTAGSRILSEMRDRGLTVVAGVIAEAGRNVQNLFEALRTELAFYVGQINLHERLRELGEPVCFPVPMPREDHRLSLEGLYDPCLTLTKGVAVIGNDLDFPQCELAVITGANQGGKTVFLRSVGLALLMMQAGMPVAADSFCAGICPSLVTHFRREEDSGMQSGKLEEELIRMSEAVDHLEYDSVLLLNESFSATNQREGSEIAEQIIHALLEKRIRVLFVTHLYEFARRLCRSDIKGTVFLRACRKNDGKRTFKITLGEPMETSHGEDLFREVFHSGSTETETPRPCIYERQ